MEQQLRGCAWPGFKSPEAEFTRYGERPYGRWAYKRAHKVSRGPRPESLSEALYWSREGLLEGASISNGGEMWGAHAQVMELLFRLTQQIPAEQPERVDAIMRKIRKAWNIVFSPLVPCGRHGVRERLPELYGLVGVLPLSIDVPLAETVQQLCEALLELAMLYHKVSMAHLTAITAIHRGYRLLQNPPPNPDADFARTRTTFSYVRLLPHTRQGSKDLPRNDARCRNDVGVLNSAKVLHGM